MTNETPQFFANRDDRRLFSVLHRPHTAATRDLAVVFCAPLFEEKLWGHRVLVNFARHLAARGIGVLRFDYFGDGESEGRFEDASVASRLRDIAAAIKYCREQLNANKVCLLGLCYGATLALLAGLDPELAVAAMVAWSPVIDGERYVNDILRGHLSAQMVVHRKVIHDREALIGQILANQPVNIEGYEIGRELFTQMRDVDLLAKLREAHRPVLVQQIAPAERVEAQYAPVGSLGNAAVQFETVSEPKFWTQQKSVFPACDALFGKTTDWLLAHAGP
jgi:exosortase A-associated hydrolase 2